MAVGEEYVAISPYNHITVCTGDIFDSPAQTLVNTVNCVGVMGKGLALQFKERYPSMFKRYKEICDMGKLEPGKLFIYNIPESYKKILNFPTKAHWRDGSKMDYIAAGLRKFVDKYKDYGISSVAFPMLGCRNGGLRYSDVFPVMLEFLKVVEIPVEIWFMENKPDPQMDALF